MSNDGSENGPEVMPMYAAPFPGVDDSGPGAMPMYAAPFPGPGNGPGVRPIAAPFPAQ